MAILMIVLVCLCATGFQIAKTELPQATQTPKTEVLVNDFKEWRANLEELGAMLHPDGWTAIVSQKKVKINSGNSTRWACIMYLDFEFEDGSYYSTVVLCDQGGLIWENSRYRAESLYNVLSIEII